MNAKNFFFGHNTPEGIKNFGLLLLRVVLACFMFTHGLAKIQHFSELSATFSDPIGLGNKWSLILIIFAEVGCSTLLFFGFFTRWAALPLIFGMSVAAFAAHGGQSFADREMALLYLAMYIVVLLLGPGNFSIDAAINKKPAKSSFRRR